MELKRRWLFLPVMLLLLLVFLTACGDRPTPVVISQGQPITQTAEALLETQNAPPTRGPSPTPSMTSTPYLTATPFPEADPTLVVAKVGNREITLAEFQARVRYERWLPLYALARRLDVRGPGVLLDLTLPENAETAALFYTLSDTESMGSQTINVLVSEQIILREAALKDLEMPRTVYDGRIAARIGVELGAGGSHPDAWDAAYAQFIADMELYTGMTESAFLESMKAQAYYDELGRIIGPQAVIPTEDITAVDVQDLLLDSREDALVVVERLQSGESITAIALSYGLQFTDSSTASQKRTVKRSENSLPEDVVGAIFNASANQVIGPFATERGWYVARILDTTLDFMSPDDIAALRQEYFRQWIVQRMDDPNYAVVYDNWRDFVPTDPLPHDVSPMMRDEFFTLANDPFSAEDAATPTPEPLGISPR